MEDRRVEVLVDVELPEEERSVRAHAWARRGVGGEGAGGLTWSKSGVSSFTPFSSRVFLMSRTRPTCFESVRFHVYDCACALHA